MPLPPSGACRNAPASAAAVWLSDRRIKAAENIFFSRLRPFSEGLFPSSQPLPPASSSIGAAPLRRDDGAYGYQFGNDE